MTPRIGVKKKSVECILYYRVYIDIKNFIPIRKQPKNKLKKKLLVVTGK